jgi:hypothetical protein
VSDYVSLSGELAEFLASTDPYREKHHSNVTMKHH